MMHLHQTAFVPSARIRFDKKINGRPAVHGSVNRCFGYNLGIFLYI